MPEKLSPKRKAAIKKTKHVEEGLLHAQAIIGGYIREVQDVRELLEGNNNDNGDGETAPKGGT